MMPAVHLYAPEAFWKIPVDERAKMRCGPGRGVLELLVPDTCWGLDISLCCAIHDFCYAIGGSEDDRREADDILLNNLIRLINATTRNRMLLKLRIRRARVYYYAVRNFGGPAFWNNKNRVQEFRPVIVN